MKFICEKIKPSTLIAHPKIVNLTLANKTISLTSH